MAPLVLLIWLITINISKVVLKVNKGFFVALRNTNGMHRRNTKYA
jgi:hypothetical protein